jgi:hypothetical protein
MFVTIIFTDFDRGCTCIACTKFIIENHNYSFLSVIITASTKTPLIRAVLRQVIFL